MLQVQHAVADFLGTTLIPELGTDVATGTTSHVHLGLIAVAALRALPDELAVVFHDLDLTIVATHLAVIALGVELSVHDVLVDELHYAHDSGEVVLHVRNLDVGDGAARRELLELALELELGKGVNLLADVHVVAVRDVAVVGNSLDLAEALLETLGELIGGRFKRLSTIFSSVFTTEAALSQPGISPGRYPTRHQAFR